METNENNFSTEVSEKENSVAIAKNAKSAKNGKKESLSDLIKVENKSINSSFSTFRTFVSDSIKSGDYNFKQVIEFLKSKQGTAYIKEINALNIASSPVQINQFNYNLFKKSSLHIILSDNTFSFLQICRITEKNCDQQFLSLDFFDANGLEVENETDLIDLIHVPAFNPNALLNFKFETKGIFSGYFCKPSLVKNEKGELVVKCDKDGKEIILGIKCKYEEKQVLPILKEMHLELIAKKKVADSARVNFVKEQKATEKADAEAKKATEKAEKAEAEAEAKAIKAKAKAEAEAKAKAKAEKAEAKKSLSLLAEKEKAVEKAEKAKAEKEAKEIKEKATAQRKAEAEAKKAEAKAAAAKAKEKAAKAKAAAENNLVTV